MTLKLSWLRFTLCIQCIFVINCTSQPKSNVDFYSIAKSQTNDKYGTSTEDPYNFYKFQIYFHSAAAVDSNELKTYHFNFTGNELIKFFKDNYLQKNDTAQIRLLSSIGVINSGKSNEMGITIIDLNDTISLINLSPEFALYPVGSCCSPYQNLIIRKRNHSVYHSGVDDELINGKILGVYTNHKGKVSGLLIAGYSNSNGAFNGLNDTYNLKYDIDKKGIIATEILNVRGGEPFDKHDQPKDIYKKNVLF